MTDLDTSQSDSTALLLVDPYNDFLSEGGKLWPYAKETADGVGLLENLKRLVSAARELNVRVFFVPHHRVKPGDFEGWRFLNTAQERARTIRFFEAGSWGGEFHPDFAPQAGDVVAHEHWTSSGFANTDLDYLLKAYGIARVVVVGLRANTCIEATARFAVELGYHTTLVRDATAAFSWDEMRAALDINAPTYAHAVVTTDALLTAWSAWTRAQSAATV